MGAWGTGLLENDGALDLIAEFEERGWAAVRAAFEQEPFGHATAAEGALAAATLVAHALSLNVHRAGASRAALGLATHGAPPADLRDLALPAIARASAIDGEIYDLWEDDSDLRGAWLDEVAALTTALERH